MQNLTTTILITFTIIVSTIAFVLMPTNLYFTAGVLVALVMATVFGRFKKTTERLPARAYALVFLFDCLFWAGSILLHVRSEYEASNA